MTQPQFIMVAQRPEHDRSTIGFRVSSYLNDRCDTLVVNRKSFRRRDLTQHTSCVRVMMLDLLELPEIENITLARHTITIKLKLGLVRTVRLEERISRIIMHRLSWHDHEVEHMTEEHFLEILDHDDRIPVTMLAGVEAA